MPHADHSAPHLPTPPKRFAPRSASVARCAADHDEVAIVSWLDGLFTMVVPPGTGDAVAAVINLAATMPEGGGA